MELYNYPYAEFTRDFDAVSLPLNAVPRDEIDHMMDVRNYVHATYANDVDRVERGAALSLSISFMHRNMAEFDVGKVAVRGNGYSIISEHLLRAIHALVCSASSSLEPMPSPADVRALAESYGKNEKMKAP